MQQSEYDKGLIEAWQGELFGEALMDRLARAEQADATLARGLARIAALERSMGQVLARLLPEGVDRLACFNEATLRAEREFHAMRDYDALIERINRGVPQARAQYVQLAKAAPPAHHHIMGLLIDHEDALGAYFANPADSDLNVLVDVAAKLSDVLNSPE